MVVEFPALDEPRGGGGELVERPPGQEVLSHVGRDAFDPQRRLTIDDLKIGLVPIVPLYVAEQLGELVPPRGQLVSELEPAIEIGKGPRRRLGGRPERWHDGEVGPRWLLVAGLIARLPWLARRWRHRRARCPRG
jgi:hypothetical protein